MSDVALKIERLPHHRGLPLPAYQTPGSAGMDLVAAVPDAEPVTVAPGCIAMIPTGLRMSVPQGYEIQIRPRSGLAAKHGITVLNAPGTVDSDYRGEVCVILVNHHRWTGFEVRRGERIAQMVVARVENASIQTVESLDDTERGEGGFGSTGR